jgi:hypothetical protein
LPSITFSTATGFEAASLHKLRKNCFPRSSLTSAAEADLKNKPLIAAVNRCATQNQGQGQVHPQAAQKPDPKT